MDGLDPVILARGQRLAAALQSVLTQYPTRIFLTASVAHPALASCLPAYEVPNG